MTKTLEKDAKVRVTNIMGVTEDTAVEPNFQIIGKEGYIYEVVNADWLHVLLPENKYYSTGSGALLRTSEVELV
jgi:hypothetical protein